MSAMLPSEEDDFLMDESSVLAFLADCEMGDEAAPVSTASSNTSTPTQCDTLTATWSDTSSSSASSPEKPIVKKSWRQRRKEEVLMLREVVKQLSAELERLKLAAGCTRRSPVHLRQQHIRPQSTHARRRRRSCGSEWLDASRCCDSKVKRRTASYVKR